MSEPGSYTIKTVNHAAYPQPPNRNEFALPKTATVKYVQHKEEAYGVRDVRKKIGELTQGKYTDDMYVLMYKMMVPLNDPEATLESFGFSESGVNPIFVERSPSFKVCTKRLLNDLLQGDSFNSIFALSDSQAAPSAAIMAAFR